MLQTTSEHYTDFIAVNCTHLDVKARKGKPVWVDRSTEKTVAVRFTNRKGETIYYIRPEYGAL